MDKVVINFAKHQKLPEGYRVEWWESDEHYHWVIDDDNYSEASCDRWDCFREAWIHSKQ